MESELRKLHLRVQKGIMDKFERKGSTIKPKSIILSEQHCVIVNEKNGGPNDFEMVYINGIESDGTLITRDNHGQPHSFNNMDDLTIEQVVGLKEKIDRVTIEYRF